MHLNPFSFLDSFLDRTTVLEDSNKARPGSSGYSLMLQLEIWLNVIIQMSADFKFILKNFTAVLVQFTDDLESLKCYVRLP